MQVDDRLLGGVGRPGILAGMVEHDEATTAKLAPADVRALRAGRAFTVKFDVTLHFTISALRRVRHPDGLRR